MNYTSGTTGRPKGVMITHRNAYMNCVGVLIHHPMAAASERSVDGALIDRKLGAQSFETLRDWVLNAAEKK